ncbi:exostosin domain-containing protein [Bizionia sp. KMM 8389]
MKLYYPVHHYDASYRSELFPLLKPFIKGGNFTDTDRKLMYGVSEKDFSIVNTIADADVIILTMSWNYYVRTKQLPLAYKLIKEGVTNQKSIWSVNTGDFGVRLPKLEDVIVFRQSGYRSKGHVGHDGYPCFISDYIRDKNLGTTYLSSVYKEKPVVGFCGQAQSSLKNAFLEMSKQVYRNVKSVCGLSIQESQSVLSTSYLRSNLLKRLENEKAVETKFIKRKQYRAGVTHDKLTHATTEVFYNNILESQYVLCVRGAGNFSVRFYETLMMGRIPLYVHTDGYLPLSDVINWKEHVVWVDYDDRHNIATRLLEFHNQLDQNQLTVLLEKNRILWQEKLTLGGFFLNT